MKFFITYIGPLVLLLMLAACRTQPGAVSGEETATLGPARVDIRGYISNRNYHEGQVIIFVESVGDALSRYDRALVLVTPITQIVTADGKALSLSELQVGQQVAIQFRGRYRESAFAAQATARQMWVER